MRRFLIINLFVFTACLFITTSCDLGNVLTDNGVPVFSGTKIIYSYSPQGHITTNFPNFTWAASGLKYEIAGVFTQQIKTSGRQIQNPTDCIAMWTTGLNGSAGSVPYQSFHKVINGVLTSQPVDAITTGTYYWAVWAYTEAMELSNSSAQITFSY